MKTVLLLSTNDNAPKHSDRRSVLLHLAAAFEDEGIQVDKAMIEDLAFSIINGQPKIEIIESDRTVIESKNTDLSQYDLVYIKNWKALADIASAIVLYLKSHGVRILCEELNHFRVVDKTSESFMLALNHIPYPDTLFCSHACDLSRVWQLYADLFPLPVIVKAADGLAGECNFLVKSQDELRKITDTYRDTKFLIQNLIPNDSDYRVIMLGYEPKLAFQRKRRDNLTHLNNTSQGAKARLIDINMFSPKVMRDCRKAARLVRREIAGVDVMYSLETGQHIILEVNASPQLATGAFLAEKKAIIQKYFKQVLDIDANDKK